MSVFVVNSLKHRILLTLLLLGIFLGLLTFITLREVIVPAFKTLETEEARKNLSRVEQAIESQFRSLSILNYEYAWWDDVYTTVNLPEIFPDFATEDIGPPEFWETVDVGMMLFFDVQGQLAWGQIIDPIDRRTQLPIEDNWSLVANKNHPLKTSNAFNRPLTGFLDTPHGLMIVAANQILRTDESGPSMGSLVVGRFLNREIAERISNASAVRATFHSVSDPGLPDSAREAIRLLSGSDQASLTIKTSETTFTRKLYTDVVGSPLVLVEVRSERRIGSIGNEVIKIALVVMSLTVFVTILITWQLLSWLIIKPAVSLTEQIVKIRQTGHLSYLPMTERKDEFGILANEFSRLMGGLAKAELELVKTRDQALQTADAKGKFLATMSHEIRTPMNGVLGMAEILQRTDLDQNQQTIIRKIQDSGNHLLNVINDILDFSKIESGKLHLEPREFNLRNLLEEILDMMAVQARWKNLELLRIFPVTVDQKVFGDRNRIGQILVNLVGNAVKFTDQGRIIVKAALSEEDTGLNILQVEVSDTGIGISEQQQAEIFNEFSQADDSTARQFQGTGLGLAICKSLLHLMEGKIKLDSEPGKGSCFRIELPLKAAEERLSASQALDSLQNLRALIVDAGDSDFEILRHHVSNYGMTIGRADNGSSTLTELKNAIADGKPYDLALLDWDMPGINGLEVARLIRADEDFAQLPIVLLSSAVTGDERLISSEIYINKYLGKPVSQSALYESLADLSRKPQRSTKRSHIEKPETKTKEFLADVLLVEDNLINQEVGRTMLEQSGCEVTIAENGAVALTILDDRKFDVILMDCHMPEMDGFEATELIRQKEVNTQSHVPIIALTADVIEGVRQKCLDAGMDDYITKPFSWPQLQQVLQTWLPDKLNGLKG